MKNMRIIETVVNDDYNPSKANNGGGYYQPTTTFEVDGIRGHFHDTSCGDFGSRYDLVLGAKTAQWGSMLGELEQYSDFNESEAKMLSDLLGIYCPSNLEV